jgi:hypothetical protein
MTPELFLKTIERADKYRITDIDTIERIALLHLSQGTDLLPWAEVDESFRQRPAYQDGALTEAPDLSVYEQEDEDPEDPDQQNPS